MTDPGHNDLVNNLTSQVSYMRSYRLQMVCVDRWSEIAWSYFEEFYGGDDHRIATLVILYLPSYRTYDP